MSVSLYKSIELESFKDNAIAIFDKANGLRLLLEPIYSNISFVFFDVLSLNPIITPQNNLS